MQINVAVVGTHGVGKTELIKQMKEFNVDFTYEEYQINSDNVKRHDFFIYVIDLTKDCESQLQCINSQLKNFIIVATKENSDCEKERLNELEKEILGREVKTFYFSLSDAFCELSIADILSYIMKTYYTSLEKLSKKLLSGLSEEQIFNINMFIIFFKNQDTVVQNVLTKIIMKQKNSIPEFIPSFQREYQDE